MGETKFEGEEKMNLKSTAEIDQKLGELGSSCARNGNEREELRARADHESRIC